MGRAFTDITGTVIGTMTAIERSGDGWLCRCLCGNERVIEKKALTQLRSCGRRCPYKQKATPRLPEEESSANRLEASYRCRANSRKQEYALCREDFRALISGSCHYCGSPPSRRNVGGGCYGEFNGVDRIDSSIGYIIENSVTCCKICNTAKMDMPAKEFEAWIIAASKHLEARNAS